ncbi:MAG: hypothetical protein A2117_01300 [Candidatus Wildermuthbacteria bacterium GWA2_46_15]|uniref:Uncharacterized protein n=1 Tax=Candidatus Wildermuthbacteria bacterium GWA2_46_15 TaxID=1802443 RepID=A0A1G2QQG5_9BACT|nr:MAG: hypothetical protein A2117_01300 [Candidatus Wildermuthbacteria bacterium GWA2_46_15]
MKYSDKVIIAVIIAAQKVLEADASAEKEKALKLFEVEKEKALKRLEMEYKTYKTKLGYDFCMRYLDLVEKLTNRQLDSFIEGRKELLEIYKSQITNLDQEKNKYQEQLFCEKTDSGKTMFYRQRIADLEIHINDLNMRCDKAKTDSDNIIKSLEDNPRKALQGLLEMVKSTNLLE